MNEIAYLRPPDVEGANRVPPGIDRQPGWVRPGDHRSRARNRSEQRGNTQPLQVMIPGRILLPIDITNCPLEVFSFINRFAGDHPVTVILLHVLNVRVLAPESRVFEDLSRMADQHLKRLAQKFLSPELSVRFRVRGGKPAQTILDEAKASNVDLLVLTSHGSRSFWSRPFQPNIIEKVIRGSPCNATLLHVRTRFNCDEDWSCVDEIGSAMEQTSLLKWPVLRLI